LNQPVDSGLLRQANGEWVAEGGGVPCKFSDPLCESFGDEVLEGRGEEV